MQATLFDGVSTKPRRRGGRRPLPKVEKLKHRRAWEKAYRVKHAERLRAEARADYYRNRDRKLALARAWKARQSMDHLRERWRASRLKRYGLTPDTFAAMLAAQGDRCGVCRESFTGTRPPDIDHHHATGRVRGLLCGSCNRGIGLFQEDPERLRAAAAYLERHQEGAA